MLIFHTSLIIIESIMEGHRFNSAAARGDNGNMGCMLSKQEPEVETVFCSYSVS